MEFEKRKKATLASMSSSAPDKSPKGDIDKPLIPLLQTLNSHPSYFTTSSCSGRISILSTPITTTAAVKKKAKGGNWVFITHEPADPSSVQNIIFPLINPTPKSTSQQNLVFRFEPLIIAVECKDVHSAQKLVSLVISCGFRESGITNVNNKRVIVAIRCSIRLEVPLGDTHKIMVSKEYLNYLVEIANEKMEANRKRSDFFHDELLKNEHPEISISISNGSGDSEFPNLNQDLGSSMITGGMEEDIHLTSEVKDDTSNAVPEAVIAIKAMVITGESVEKLHLWGHATCTLEATKSLLVFGGFGRHARRKDSWVLDSVSGQLQLVDFPTTPSPRLGHTASLVGGELMFVIGGRGDPGNVLNDVWILDTTNYVWKQVQCTGTEFPHSHRHASAVIGSNIYVFGGIQNGSISSGMYRLDTRNLRWEEVVAQGQKPSPRHSHTLVAYGSHLFMFGGFDGVKAVGDFYSFDIRSCTWKEEKMGPYARFSHMMFVYKNLIGVIGGCPIKQHYQELWVYNGVWKRMKLGSVGEDLFVRSTASVVGDDLVIVGGGASCYAFGTKFSQPMKLNLLSLAATAEPLHWVLRVDKKHAKPVKDLLKESGWLDAERKVYTQESGVDVCFPITKEFVAVYQQDDQQNARVLGATIHADDVAKVRKASSSPLKVMKEAVASLLNHHNLPTTLLEQLPTRWERLGDIVVLPTTCFKDSVWESLGKELWSTVADSLGATRLARQGRVCGTGTRDSGLEILVGVNDGWVEHRENGVVYSFDATKCMFSWGNLSEKRRMGELDCKEEVIVDLFAGIGYFTLPFLVKGNAKMVYACEWNPHAIEALRRNLEANGVADRCVLLQGDNRVTAPKGVANRVNLGLLPSSEASWETAVRALRREGGMMHVHGNVKDTEEESWAEQVSESIKQISTSQGYNWEVSVEHIERVKWYAPHIRHLVVDLNCKQIES